MFFLGQAASTITGSPVFKKLLEVVLTIGNFLNQGSFRGNAQGVKINFLGELKSTKVSAMTTASCAEGPDEGVGRRGRNGNASQRFSKPWGELMCGRDGGTGSPPRRDLELQHAALPQRVPGAQEPSGAADQARRRGAACLALLCGL
eukprot:SAG25_NODE_152_length_13602_cov_15.382878_5_plen_147_part_00